MFIRDKEDVKIFDDSLQVIFNRVNQILESYN